MRIYNISTQPFGSIQIQKSKMDWQQRGASERLYDTIKYSDKYSELTERNKGIDIYILPKKNDLEIRLMDLYSGNFIRNKKGKILNTIMNVWPNDGYEKATDRTLNLFEKVTKDEISKPDEDMSDFISGNTDISKINPRKAKRDIAYIKREIKNLMEDLDASREDAEDIAYDSFINEYNDDGVF